MSTSGKPLSPRGLYRRASLCDLSVAAVLILFGIVYEVNSFGVFSFYMIYAFVPFFALGFAEMILSFSARLPYDRPGIYLFRWGACVATCGSLVRGILEIYGTTTDLLAFYPVVVYLFLIGGTVRLVYRIIRHLKSSV